jgi:phenylpropionate dioxygenase-like ring-hydroxylating dioxygenase large terminal subunit
MFARNMYARNQWYAAAVASELADGFLPRTILEEPILMYRLKNGEPVALEDRCSHRNVPLSLGRRAGDNVQCLYHGAQFGASGACMLIPDEEGTPAARYAIRKYPVVERDGFIWLWPGDPSRADSSMIPDYSWHSGPGWAGAIFMKTVKAGYVFNIENLLDLSHIAYVHTATISTDGFENAEVTTVVGDGFVEVRRNNNNVDSGDRLRNISGGRRVDRRSFSRFIPPSNFMLHSTTFDTGGSPDDANAVKNRFGAPSTPETASSHHHFMTAFRNYSLDDKALTQHMVNMVLTAFTEDEILLVAQQEKLDGGKYLPEKLFQGDKGAIAGVRMLKRMIEKENLKTSAIA